MARARERVQRVREMLKITNTLEARKIKRREEALARIREVEDRERAERILTGLESARELLHDAVKRREVRPEAAEVLEQDLSMLSARIKHDPESLKHPETLKKLKAVSNMLGMVPEIVPEEIASEGVKGVRVERAYGSRGEPSRASYNPLDARQEYMITKEGIVKEPVYGEAEGERHSVYLSPESVKAHEVQHARNYEEIQRGAANYVDEYLAFLAQAWESPADVKRMELLHASHPAEEHAFGARTALISKELGLRPEDILRSRKKHETDQQFEKRVMRFLESVEEEYKQCKSRGELEKLRQKARRMLEKA